jgi:hypothetical protein
MPAALIDGLEVYYETRGSGQPLLMLAPGGFDSTADKWLTASAWKEINALTSCLLNFNSSFTTGGSPVSRAEE